METVQVVQMVDVILQTVTALSVAYTAATLRRVREDARNLVRQEEDRNQDRDN